MKKSLRDVTRDVTDIRSIGTRIILVSLLNCVILILVTLVSMNWLIKQVEEQMFTSHLETEICYLEDVICKDGDAYWHIEDGNFMYGDTVLGDGSVFGANTEPFLYIRNRTGTNCYVGRAVEAADGSTATDFLRVAGSTTDADGNSIAGTLLSDNVSVKLAAGEDYSGYADVQGTRMYCLYKPLYDKDGSISGFISVGRSKEDIYRDVGQAVTWVVLIVLIVVLGAGVAIVAATRKAAVAIKQIEDYLKRIGKGELPEDPLEIDTHDQLKTISKSVNEMVVSLREKEQIGAELSVANQIQHNLLPRTFPPFPQHDEFELYATMEPAREVGGDFYDFFEIDSSHIAVVIADVSGKGVPASLFMVTARTLIKDHALMGLKPADVLRKVNNILCEGNDSGMFVTAWFGILDIRTGHLTYANAGHNPPLIKRGKDSYVFLKSAPGLILAGIQGFKYKQFELDLEPGDALFLYTDGVTEATDAKDALYGNDRLLAYMNAHVDESVRMILYGLRADIDRFAGNAEQFDDITMLLLQYNKYSSALHRTFPAEVEELPAAQAFIEEALEEAGCPMKTLMQISVAFEELFVNIAHYAYPGTDGNVDVEFTCVDNRAYISLIDSGIPFNPLSRKDPDITAAAEDRDPGGLGIFMTKKIMDEVKYRCRESGNMITIEKSF